MGDTERNTDADLRARTAAADFLKGPARDMERDRAVAVNVLNEEIGAFGPYSKEYHFDAVTRDVLLAHGRQDAANALVAAISLRHRVEVLARRLALLIVLCTAIIIAAIWWVRA
jgi:hypothetical protein